MASNTYAQLQCMKQGGPFELVQVPKPTELDPDSVLVQTKVVSLNGLDKKQRDYGIMIASFPHLLGIEGAGVVDSVGSNVQHLREGDEVTMWASGKAHGQQWGGSYQEMVTMPAHYVAKRPKNVSIEEAAALPICYVTAVYAIIGVLNVPLPQIKGTTKDGKVPRSILILGGGSNVGAGAIQLLRVAYPELQIYATSSAKHFERLTAYGASKLFDYHSDTITADIVAASPDGRGVDMVIDCVGAAAGMQNVADLFDSAGERHFAAVINGSPIPELKGVTVTPVNGYELVHMQGSEQVIPGLTELVESGAYKVPFPVKTVGHGLQAIAKAMDMTEAVSGEKLVVRL